MSAGASTSPSHLSIGDVLNHLRQEFPDITISKIRFLESQGLIDPERTPSGYRKFYDGDVARLRWILHQQKEHFLPLKVIKERLDRLDLDPDAPGAPAEVFDSEPDRPVEPSVEAAVDTAEKAEPEAGPGGNGDTAPATRRASRSRRRPERPRSERPRSERPRSERREVAIETPMLPLDDTDGFDEPVAPPGRAVPTGGVSLTRAELAAAAGLEDAQVVELESFGLLAPSPRSGDHPLFDEEALTIARMAAGFYAHGIEPRHLRMYKHFAQREAALFEQVLLAYLRQRNPEARAKAQHELADLARLGRGLRAALLVTAVREAIAD